MVQYTVVVEGMRCGMCEAHVNDAIRRAFPVRKLKSSHTKNETVFLADGPIDEARLRQVLGETGYTVGAITSAPWEKRGLFSRKRD